MNDFKPQAEGMSRRARAAYRKNRRELEAYIEKHPWLDGIYDPNVVNTILYPKSQSAADSTRNPSTAVWANCPWEALNSDPRQGFAFWDDFFMEGPAIASNTGVVGQWDVYAGTACTLTDGAKEGGVLVLNTPATDNLGIHLLSHAGSIRFVTTSTLAANRRAWFECRWARGSITTDVADYFVGLMSPTLTSGLPVLDVPITQTDDTLSTTGGIFGFHSCSNTAVRGGPTEIANAFVLTSGTVNYPTNLTTMMASSSNTVLAGGTFVKTGFMFDPAGPLKRITSATARQTAGQVKRAMFRFFINNLELPTFLTSDDVLNATATQAFPTEFMAPVIAIQNTSAGAATMSVDWLRVAQEANS